VGSACGAVDNSCGGNNNCGCPTGDACFNSKCCAPIKCTDYSTNLPAAVNAPCGALDNTCGGKNNCACPSGKDPVYNDPLLFQCTAGKCACVPDTCRGRSGLHGDGCGGTLNCGT
jgi:hypothetical protein